MTKDYYNKQPTCKEDDQACWNRELTGVGGGRQDAPPHGKYAQWTASPIPAHLPPPCSPCAWAQVAPVRAYFVKGSDNKMYNVTGLAPAEATKMRTGRKVKLGGKATKGDKDRHRWAATGSVQVTAEASRPPTAGGGKMLKRGLLATGGLATVTRSDINTLFIPLSFSGCPTATAGTNYGAPSYNQTVRRGICAPSAFVAL